MHIPFSCALLLAKYKTLEGCIYEPNTLAVAGKERLIERWILNAVAILSGLLANS